MDNIPKSRGKSSYRVSGPLLTFIRDTDAVFEQTVAMVDNCFVALVDNWFRCYG